MTKEESVFLVLSKTRRENEYGFIEDYVCGCVKVGDIADIITYKLRCEKHRRESNLTFLDDPL